MPIRPENVDRYPANWQEIRARIQARARNRCELCGVKNHELGARINGVWCPAIPDEGALRLIWPKPGEYSAVVHPTEGPTRARIIRIVCTTAHWFDDRPEACDDSNLKFACQRCHLEHDRQMHTQNRYENARKGRAIGDFFGEPSPEERDALRARLRRKAANPPSRAG